MKVRRLEFDLGSDRDIEFFNLFYEGLLGGAAAEPKRTMANARQEARLFRPLEAISEPRVDVPVFRTLAKREGETVQVDFEIPDFDLALKYLDQASWTPIASVKAVDMDDWIRSAALVDKG